MADEDQGNSTLVAVGQQLVNAVANLNNTVSATFPNWVSVPATATATGVAGQVAYDTSHFYWCTSANSWLRVTGTSF